MRLTEIGESLLFLWRKLLALASNLLVILGLALVAYGIVHWWKGLPYPVAILLFGASFGGLSLGLGLSLRRPQTTATNALACGSFVVSGAIFLFLFVTPPWEPLPVFFFFICCAGALDNYRRLRQKSRER